MPLVISVLVFALVCALVYWIWTLLPLPQPAKNIVLIVLLILLLIALVGYLGPAYWPARVR